MRQKMAFYAYFLHMITISYKLKKWKKNIEKEWKKQQKSREKKGEMQTFSNVCMDFCNIEIL